MPSTRKDKQREKKAKKVSKEELNKNVTEQTSTTGELSSDKLATSPDPTDIESDPNSAVIRGWFWRRVLAIAIIFGIVKMLNLDPRY